MEPTLSDFDLIFALPVSSKKIQPGDIVVVKTKNVTIIHRLIEKSDDKIVTKGDNLEFPECFSFSEISSLKKVIFVIKKGLFLIVGAGILILSAGKIVLLRSKRSLFYSLFG
jgi:signal peptidase I